MEYISPFQEDVCHEMVQDMPYLEQIIQEVLRFYPASLRCVI